MSVQLQKPRHPIVSFCLRLLRRGVRTSTVSAPRPAALTVADLAALPKQTQLLVAHFLELNNNDLTLLNSDTDVNTLFSAGWLTSIPSSTIGVLSFKFKPSFWRQLRSLQRRFLTEQLLSELAIYRHRKTVVYPWVW